MDVSSIEKHNAVRVIIDRRSKDGNIIPREDSGIHVLPPMSENDISIGEVWDCEAVSFPGSPAVVVRAKERVDVIADYEPLYGDSDSDDFNYNKYKSIREQDEGGLRDAADPESDPVGAKNDMIGQGGP